jgi:hypothetical protein
MGSRRALARSCGVSGAKGKLRLRMNAQDLICAVTVLFIIGMLWLRTRMQYVRRGARGTLQLQSAGKVYFAALTMVLVLGWFAAPPLGRMAWSDASVTPGLLRGVWFIVTYYVFILVHRIIKTRGVEVYRVTT